MARRRSRALVTILAAALGMTSTACAQLPAAGGSAGAAGAAAGAAGSAAGMTGLMGKICQNLAACKAKFCASPCGQMFSQGMAPLKCLTGGSFGNCCPTTPTPAQQAAPGASGAAAQIQADTAEAKARVAAVEYLGTVDCHYWPEAEKTLIESLRADRNECVRFAAARVLGSGCCCTSKTIAALTLTASGEESDGNPSENSPRVRAAAAAALSRCAVAPVEPIKPQPPERPEPTRPELPPAISLERVDPAVRRSKYYDETVGQTPPAVLAARARRAVARASSLPAPAGMPPGGSQSLLGIASRAQLPKTPSRAEASKEPDPPSSPPAPPVARRTTEAAPSPEPERPKTLQDLLIKSTGAR